MKSTTASHYTRTALGLHWLIAGFILAALFMGWTMTEMEVSPTKLKLYNYHKWVGVTVLALALVRVGWRFTHRPPPLEPVTGWAYSNASGYPIVYLGRVPLPDLLDRDRLLAGQLVKVHGTLAAVLAAAVALHVLAALEHHFIRKDRTLRRMFSWRAPDA
jgi:cytochrome b561